MAVSSTYSTMSRHVKLRNDLCDVVQQFIFIYFYIIILLMIIHLFFENVLCDVYLVVCILNKDHVCYLHQRFF